MSQSEHPSTTLPIALKRISQVLDVPVEDFLGKQLDTVASDLLALVRLWPEIKDSQGRHRVLSLAQHEAERCGYKGSV